MNLGSTLLKHRRRNNYSQKEVANLLEVSQSTYCDWESNTSYPKTENLVKISQLYEIEITELLSEGNINVVNSPNTMNINSPNARVETPEALLKVADGLEKLIILVEKIFNEKKQ
jgi:transcriptional regulator with XRE-family HTH domain